MAITITPKKKEALQQLGLNDANDIIQFFPMRYEENNLIPYALWQKDSRVIFAGPVITSPKTVYYRARQSLVSFEVDAGFEHLRVTIFNRPWIAKKRPGDMVTVIGRYEGHRQVLAFQITDEPLQQVCGIKAVYSLKDKVPAKWFSQLMDELLTSHQKDITDIIPADIRVRQGFMPRYQALRQIHFPTDKESLTAALKTLKYEEFLLFQLTMLQRRKAINKPNASTSKVFDRQMIDDFIIKLPYQLKADQKTAVNEILKDMADSQPMCRLLQGDVGCGKTIVAFIAMKAAVLAGCQAVIMAPTAILAQQHFQNMQKTFPEYAGKIVLLTSGQNNKERQDKLQMISDGTAVLIVGTHAVFQQAVVFNKLGLIVTDEQQRFGVKQRQQLQDKGENADLLLMSATPIPRTLASSLYGDMDVSSIMTRPQSNRSVTTELVLKNSFMGLVNQIEPYLLAHDQMYVVCASIEKNDDYKIRNVNDVYQNLLTYYHNKHTVGLIHGQMSDEEKDQVMALFVAHKLDILVTTTVVEVGVDVPDANLMIIYDANRFGLSQLHQLRGRIGRGNRPAYCWLLTSSTDQQALDRLQIIKDNNDGFKIAYYDLQLRGPGDLLGYRQSGLPIFALGNIIVDEDLLQLARTDALKIEPQLQQPQYAPLAEYLRKTNDQSSYHPD